jgi:hypothetical protein
MFSLRNSSPLSLPPSPTLVVHPTHLFFPPEDPSQGAEGGSVPGCFFSEKSRCTASLIIAPPSPMLTSSHAMHIPFQIYTLEYVNRFEYWYRNDLGVGYTWRNILTPAQRGTETFDWNSMPLSSFLSPWLGSILYLTGVRMLKGFMKNRKSISDHYPSFNYVLLVHNLFLTVLSLVMFVMTTYHVVRHMQR